MSNPSAGVTMAQTAFPQHRTLLGGTRIRVRRPVEGAHDLDTSAHLLIERSDVPWGVMSIETAVEQPVVDCRALTGSADPILLALALELAFEQHPEARSLRLAAATCARFGRPWVRDLRADEPVVERADFCQIAPLWRAGTAPLPELAARSASDVPHPLRPPASEGWVYSRHSPWLDREIAFRRIEPEADLERFHGWMNQPRVAEFWELAKPRAVLLDYLTQVYRDPHLYSLIGTIDGEPFGYFEVYWSKEDRLGPYYEAHDYDRGWHGLVGETRFLGGNHARAWIEALTHYLFLDDPRTRRIVGEPRADNARIIRHGETCGYRKVKEFDFPHKRAALMQCGRMPFFAEVLR